MNLLPAASNPLLQVLPMVLDSVPTEATRTVYRRTLTEFLDHCHAQALPFTKATVQAWRTHLQARGLAASSVNVQISAIRKLAAEAADNGYLDPAIAAGISRIQGLPRLGVRAGNWLTLEQAQALLLAPDPGTLKGIRDCAILALLLGCGLRRSELCSLDCSHMQQREGRWVLIDIHGKGGRVRSVPVPPFAYTAQERWREASGIAAGKLFRRVRYGKIIGDGLTIDAIYFIAGTYAKRIGITVAPHDLRRSFAKLCHKAGAALEQIQLSLGHASIQTTERYLGLRQDLANAPGDRIGLTL